MDAPAERSARRFDFLRLEILWQLEMKNPPSPLRSPAHSKIQELLGCSGGPDSVIAHLMGDSGKPQ